MIHICKVCATLDNDKSLKNCFYCSVCKAWICESDRYRIDRRMRAMRLLKISKLAFIVFVMGVVSYSEVIPAENKLHIATLKWTKPVGSFDGFNVYRADTCHDFILLKKLDKVFRYVDPAVIGGETYKYKVRTVLNGIESNDSVISFTTVPY